MLTDKPQRLVSFKYTKYASTRNIVNIYEHIPEVIRPQRPPAPPTDYFQMNLGGYDPYSLHLAPRATVLPQGGYVGCVRGFKIADHVVDLPRKAQDNVDQGNTIIVESRALYKNTKPDRRKKRHAF